MSQQAANTVMMIRPVQFRMNEQTAVNNYYQKKIRRPYTRKRKHKSTARI